MAPTKFRFRLEIDGVAQAAFSEAAAGETTLDAIDYREGDEALRRRKLKGLQTAPNITLKRGITGSTAILSWRRNVLAGQTQSSRKQVVIVVQDESGADRARFIVTGALPVKYDAAEFNAKGNEVAIETLELSNEGIELVN